MTLYKTYRRDSKDWIVIVKVTGKVEKKLIRIENAEEIFNDNPNKSIDFSKGLVGFWSISALINQRDVISMIFKRI